jgi:hypothetical protein
MGVIFAAISWVVTSAGSGSFQDLAPRWELDERGGPPEIQGSLEESPVSTLVAEGHRLVRRGGGKTIQLGCTSPVGTGAIRDLARDPAGITIVAAEEGVFVASPEVEWSDAVESVDALLPGRPTSVHVDDLRRVWVATEEAFGVFHPTFTYANRFGDSDGLPSPGPYRVGPGAVGEIRVATGAGTFRYRPDRGPPPLPPGLLVDGAIRPSGATRGLSFGEAVRFERPADRNLPLLFRVDGHHLWRSMGSAMDLGGFHPGRHGLEVVAVDRDLRLSEPWTLTVEVAYPPRYSKGFVATLGALATGGVFAAFLVGARARARPWLAGWSACISTALLLCVALQIFAGLFPHARGWPFVGFSMYTEVYRPDDVVYRTGIVGLGLDGSRRAISPYALGHTFDDPWQVYRPLLVGGEEPNRAFALAYNARFPEDSVGGIQVEAERHRLTASGPVRVAPLVLSRFLLEEPDAPRR